MSGLGGSNARNMMRFSLSLLSSLVVLLMLLCDSEQPLASEETESLGKGRGLGVCFMGSQPCMDIYEDKGEYTEHVERDTPVGGKTSSGIPVCSCKRRWTAQSARPGRAV
jgi:hypothetical protein